MAAWVVPAIMAAAGIVNQLIQSRASKKQTQATAKANKGLAEYQYKKDLEMWERQNAFNSPEQQMLRLSRAGLNPNLVYGSGAVGNQSGPAPRYDAPTVDLHYSPFQIPEMIGMYQDFQMRKAQIDNVKASTENTHQRTVNEGIRSFLLDLGLDVGRFDLSQKKVLAPYQATVAAGEARKTDAVVEQEFTKLMLMRREELSRLLETQAQEKRLSQMDIEKEQKAADLLYNQYRNQWMKMGITTSDHPLLRVFLRMMHESGVDTFDEMKGKGKEFIKSYVPAGPYKMGHRFIDQIME